MLHLNGIKWNDGFTGFTRTEELLFLVVIAKCYGCGIVESFK